MGLISGSPVGWGKILLGENHVNRRSLLKTIGAGSLLAAQPSGSAAGAARGQAEGALARHRNLFNGDSCTYFFNPELWQPEGGPYSAKAIHRYVDLLAES